MTMNTKYDMNRNPPYQIDWASAASGKRVSGTKRRVRFRFGFSNAEAIAQGMSGTECRGEEHEVGLVWSLTSGKRVVVFDNQEVHFSMGRRGETKFEATWPLAGGHIMKIIAHATLPLRPIPGFKQFDLFLDGMSFFHMPHIYELGVQRGRRVATAVVPVPRHHSVSYDQPGADRRFAGNTRHFEEAHSMNSSRSFSSHEAVSNGFAGPARRNTLETAPVAAPAPMPVLVQDVLSDTPRGADLLSSPASTQSNVPDQFTPVVVQPAPPTFQDVSNHILSAYGPSPAAPAPLALANESHTHYNPQQQQYPPASAPATQQQQQQQQYYYGAGLVSPDASAAASSNGFQPPQQHLVVDPNPNNQAVQAPQGPQVITPTMMKPLELSELRDSPPPVDAMDQAIQNLVNFDITETKMTPEQIKMKKQKELMKKTEPKSRPKAPAATNYHVGTNASLADIQKHKQPSAPPAKEVMKMHAFDPAAAQAGMMVVYGQQQPQQSPPHGGGFAGGIPASTGFGAGVYNGYGRVQPVRAGY